MAISAKIRIVVASPREIWREALGALLSAQAGFTVVARVGCGNDLVEQVRRSLPDVLLLESDPSSNSWLSTLGAVGRLATPLKAILLSEASPESLLEGMELGLRGIVAKDATADMLFTSIRSVSAGEYWIGRDRIGHLVDCVRRIRNGRAAASNPFGLTARERDVIHALLTGATNKEIAQRLSISSQAVRHHLCNIFDKLGVSNRLELGLFAIEHRLFETSSPRPRLLAARAQ